MIKEFKINDILKAMETISKKDRKIEKKNNKQKRTCFFC